MDTLNSWGYVRIKYTLSTPKVVTILCMITQVWLKLWFHCTGVKENTPEKEASIENKSRALKRK